VSELGKGRTRSGQVGIVKSNASEPLKTCRKNTNDVETARLGLAQDQHGRSLFMARAASGMKVARARFRLLCGTWEPVVPMLREQLKRRPLKSQSTDAEHRGGVTRSSDEGFVMELERRGCLIWLETREQLATG
jgi:hypothetical protein